LTLQPTGLLKNMPYPQEESMVLLINPNFRHANSWGLAGNRPALPLELLYVSASLDEKRIFHRIIDLWGANKQISDFKEFISEARIAVVNSGASYVFWRDGIIDIGPVLKNIQHIKKIKPDIKIILIGPHGTVMPEIFFETGADIIFRGEPDIALTGTIESILNNSPILNDYLSYSRSGRWIVNNSFACVDDLDKLPIIPYQKLNLNNYLWPFNPKLGKQIRTVYEASRGCIYNCKFCFKFHFRSEYRVKSIGRIEEELNSLKRLNIDYVFLIDECFGIDFRWAEKVCSSLQKRNIKWGMQTRLEILTEDRIRLLAESGCIYIELGIESIDNKILEILGKPLDLHMLNKTLYLLGKNSIITCLFFMLGSPGETKQTAKSIYDFILNLPLDKVIPYVKIFTPLPQTGLWKVGLEKGYRLKNWSDVPKYAGIIMNDFKDPLFIKREIVRLKSKIKKKQIKLQLTCQIKNFLSTNILKFLIDIARYQIQSVLIIAPWLSELYQNIINSLPAVIFHWLDYNEVDS